MICLLLVEENLRDEVNKKTNSAVDEALINNKKTLVKFKIAVLLESKLDNNKQARLEMHNDFDHKDIVKEIESYFTI